MNLGIPYIYVRVDAVIPLAESQPFTFDFLDISQDS